MAIAELRTKGRKKFAPSRIDVVFIRKSTPSQNVEGQMANVTNMLKAIGVTVPDKNWFVCTVSRAKVQANSEFQRLLDLVKAGKVRTVYIESQDRWGTARIKELFSLLNFLAEHGTGLYDLREKIDLTEEDDSTELQAFVGGLKSKKERIDIAYRSLRTRVNTFKDNGSWPTGTHPFGFGKRCFGADGKLLWEWQPISRSRGQLFYATTNGKLSPGPENVRIPQKSNRDRTILVPSKNASFVATVRLVFELFTKAGLSRRKIALRLNKEGRTFYTKQFTCPYVTQILTNPAYVGDTHFGKSQTGELRTFDNDGIVVEVKRGTEKSQREVKRRIVKKDTHEGLIDRRMWEFARSKLEDERRRTSFSPRNPAYYLKPIFVCGHCGKNMTGRTDPQTRKVLYVCSSYVNNHINGQQSKCGFHSISHEDAEKLLLGKIKEMGIEFQKDDGPMRTSLDERLANLGHADDESIKKWSRYLSEGLKAFAVYLRDTFPDVESHKEFQRLQRLALDFYFNDEDSISFSRLPIKNLKQLREAIVAAENTVVEKARNNVAKLKQEHADYTKAWVKASERQQAILKEEIDRLEIAISEWEPRTVPLSKRFEVLYATETERQSEREELLAEWPTLQAREKGEAMRRLFNTVALYWDRSFRPASKKPTRPRTTNRPGRFRYTLDTGRIQWSFATTDLMQSW